MAADCKSAALRATEVRILHCPPLRVSDKRQAENEGSHRLERFPFPVSRYTAARPQCGSNSGVESQPSKLLVAGSNPVSRSTRRESGNGNRKSKVDERGMSKRDSRFPVPDYRARAHVAQSVEHVLGKDEVTSSILVVGSTRRMGVSNFETRSW